MGILGVRDLEISTYHRVHLEPGPHSQAHLVYLMNLLCSRVDTCFPAFNLVWLHLAQYIGC